jgi:hypothetical protein
MLIQPSRLYQPTLSPVQARAWLRGTHQLRAVSRSAILVELKRLVASQHLIDPAIELLDHASLARGASLLLRHDSTF